jgi:DNA-binding transcriptional regulator YiaG
MERKITEYFLYEGLGFPILLRNLPMIKTRGEWIPDIDYNKLQKAVLIELAKKPTSLSGNEIKFIRKYFRKTLEAFGLEFGVSHVAVMDWENKKNQSVKINPATEKCIRLFIMDSLFVADEKFREGYHYIEIKKLAEQQKVKTKAFKNEPLILDASLKTLIAC